MFRAICGRTASSTEVPHRYLIISTPSACRSRVALPLLGNAQGAGVPRYVDWEWVEIGDPAQDLAYIGAPVAAPPWYLPMRSEQVEYYPD